MTNLQIVKTYTNETAGPIAANTVVAFTANDGAIKLAVDGTKPLAGVAVFGCTNEGDALGILQGGPDAQVVCGGAIVPGDFLTAGAAGKAKKAVAGDYYFGMATEAGAADDIIIYLPTVGLLPTDATP